MYLTPCTIVKLVFDIPLRKCRFGAKKEGIARKSRATLNLQDRARYDYTWHTFARLESFSYRVEHTTFRSHHSHYTLDNDEIPKMDVP